MTQATTESELDPRHPLVRLGAFFDDGEFTTITPVDDRGVIAAVGRADGTHVVAFATDPTVQGGAMGMQLHVQPGARLSCYGFKIRLSTAPATITNA